MELQLSKINSLYKANQGREGSSYYAHAIGRLSVFNDVQPWWE